MAISIKRALALAAEGELSVDDVLRTLYESEGVQGCRLNPRPGHPLQHVAVLMYPVASRKDKSSRMARSMYETAQGQNGLTPLEREYWSRGPGNPRNKSHSMFADDEQAATLIRDGLCGEGGLTALRYLSITDEISVFLATFLRGSTQTLRRVGDLNSQNTFTQNPESTSMVAMVLHSRCGTLHIHTAYPTRPKQRPETFRLNPFIGWELEVTDMVTRESRLIRTHLAPGVAP